MTSTRKLAIVAASALLGMLGSPRHSNAQGFQVEEPVHFDTSQPFGTMGAAAAAAAARNGEPTREVPNRDIPLAPMRHRAKPEANEQAPAPAAVPRPFPAQIILKVDGISQGRNYEPPWPLFPPDANGSAGVDRYVQWVNTAVAIFDKADGHMVPVGGSPPGPFDGNALWKGFGGKCEEDNDGDPIVIYDKMANRWVMSQFAVKDGPPFSECIAVSVSKDPAGSYHRYEYRFQNFDDYPKFGVWPDGYYATFEMWRHDSFLGGAACAFERARMLDGQKARMVCFNPSEPDATRAGALLPADLDGVQLPPSGSPEYIVGFSTDDTLKIWNFLVDWSKPLNSRVTGPFSVSVPQFQPACFVTADNNWQASCALQPHTQQRIDVLSDRLMYRAAYRNFGTHESLLLDHTVAVESASGIRWYELRRSGIGAGIDDPAFAVFQQGTVAPDRAFRWLPSIAMDKAGNILLAYAVSSTDQFPSLAATGRLAADPGGAMSQEVIIGKGERAVPVNRWGDYGSVSIDPADDCTFWVTGEFLGASAATGVAASSETQVASSAMAKPAAQTGGHEASESLEQGDLDWDTVVASIRFPTCK